MNSRILILTDMLLIYNRIPTTYFRETTEYTKTENDPKINQTELKWIIPLATFVVVLLFIGVTLILRRRRSESSTIYLLFLKKLIS